MMVSKNIDSIFTSVNVNFSENEYSNINGHQMLVGPRVAVVDIQLKLYEEIKSVEEIEDIVGERWFRKKLGMSFSELKEAMPELFI